MLEVDGLTLHYGQSQILHGIALTARQGEVTCIMGTNGVGKTSLMKALAGTHPRSGGRVVLDGAEVPRLPAQGMAARGLAIVPQGRMIFPLLTVRENLETAFALLPRGERRIPDRIYDLFPVLRDMGGRRGGDLSGGQQQQLAIARAMIMRPKVLLLDEPTEGIQPSIIADIGRVIDLLKAEGQMAIILVEQYLDFAWARGDAFHIMRQGRIAHAARRADLTAEALRGHLAI
jgi:urea transport system ATP-binding protein